MENLNEKLDVKNFSRDDVEEIASIMNYFSTIMFEDLFASDDFRKRFKDKPRVIEAFLITAITMKRILSKYVGDTSCDGETLH